MYKVQRTEKSKVMTRAVKSTLNTVIDIKF